MKDIEMGAILMLRRTTVACLLIDAYQQCAASSVVMGTETVKWWGFFLKRCKTYFTTDCS